MPIPLPVSPEKLESLCQEYGTALQIYDEKLIRENARSLMSAFKSHFPSFREFFAVKALPNPAILRILNEEGCGMDCSSVAELWISQQLGVPGDNIMYTSNYTSEKDLATAFDMGVIINLDDISLIDSLLKVRGKMPEFISFRLNPGLGRTDSATKSNVLGGPDAKFGVPPDQILDAYRKAKENGSTRFGIHMMTGSCVLNDDYWQETITKIFEAMASIRQELDIEFEFVNIGGGLGIPYKPEQASCDIEGLAKKVKTTFDKCCSLHKLDAANIPGLCMENGRYMTGPFGWLVARCQATKTCTYAGKTSKFFGLDASMANLMRPGMYGSYHHITVPKRMKDPSNFAEMSKPNTGDADSDASTSSQYGNVVGTLCENNDWFGKDMVLPATAQKGDLFVIHDTGAHSHSMGFQYNGKTRAPEILLRLDGTVQLIRERETIKGLFANCVMPTDLWPKSQQNPTSFLNQIVAKK